MIKFTAALVFLACLQSQAGIGQNVTLKVENARVTEVFHRIQKQTGYYFFYNESVIRNAHPLTLNLRDQPLTTVLDKCFNGQPFTYTIVNKMIVVKEISSEPPAAENNIPPPPVRITGKVTDSTGAPVVGATVMIKGTKRGTTTKDDGSFVLESSASAGALVISSIGFAAREVQFSGSTDLKIVLTSQQNKEEEIVIVGYGSQKKATLTGSVATVKMAS